MKTINTPKNLPGINQSFGERHRIPLALVSAIVILLLALSAKAGNILNDPGFESGSLFSASTWTQHSPESWSSAPANSVNGTEPGGAPITIGLVHTGANALWMQGTYGNGGAEPLDESISQTFACAPGNTYTADAWYSAYLFCSNHIGGDDGQLNACYGTVPPFSATQGGGAGLFEGTGAGAQEDGWVEVRFLDSGNNVLADYKSMIIDPAYLGTATISGCYQTNLSYSGTLPLSTNSTGNIGNGDVYLTWADFPVTNQYDITKIPSNTDPDTDIANGAITNTLGAGQPMVAPAGAAHVEFSIHIFQDAGNHAGAPFWDDATLSQVGGASPSIITPTPNGLSFFTAASNFTFNVTSASTGGAPLPTNPTSGIGIVVNGVNQTANLQFSGFPTNLNATLQGLASNTIYTVTVNVTNSVGLTSVQSVTFDTFPTNVFVVSAEDYDYTNTTTGLDGQFFENPTPTAAPAANSYFGTGGTQGVDLGTYNGGPDASTELVRNDGRAAMQVAADIQLPLYAAQNNPAVVNVQIAYNNVGNWFNYTRNYPTGNYLAYLRYNNQFVNNVESLNLLTSGYGTANQTTNNLGVFIGANTGAGYAWVPLTDTFGNKIILNLGAGQNTLQLLSGNNTTNSPGGIVNFVDFILVPAGTTFPPFINNLTPNNVNPPLNGFIFNTNIPTISFSVGSHFSTVASNNIQTFINGVNVSSQQTITGNNTNWNVSLPCPQNDLITLVINAKDANGLSNNVTETFDTFTQDNMMIEGVDWDFNGGQFIDNPIPSAPIAALTNSYYNGGIFGTNQSVFNVDSDGMYFNFNEAGNGPNNYRTLDEEFFCEPEVANNNLDFVRNKFATNGSTDYDLGFFYGGEWNNYTRTFPTGNYNVYGRMAGGAGPWSGTTLSLVTSGTGTSNQTTQLLGSFADANAAGWGTWHWAPMRDTNGNLATISLGGVQTLKLTSGNNVNVNFLMFVPKAVSLSVNLSVSISGSSVSLKFPTVSGHNYTVLYNNTLSGGTWQSLSSAAGDGTVKTVGDTVTPGVPIRFYRLQIQ